MTQVTRIFTYTRAGQRVGWKLDSMPTFDPCYAPHVVMHDAFEHQPDDGDSMTDEMMAFGAMAYFRVVSNQWDHFDWQIEPEQPIAEDILGFMNEVNWEMPLCWYPLNDEIADFFETTVMDELLSQHRTALGFNLITFNVAEHWCIQNCFAWIAKGYDRAKERWNYATPSQVGKLWCKTLDDILTVCKDSQQTVGSKLTIKYNTNTLTSDVTLLRIPNVKDFTAVNDMYPHVVDLWESAAML